MDKQLSKIRRAYDLTVEQYKKGIDPLDNIPERIRNSEGYRYILANRNKINSDAPDIKKYLNPKPGKRFLDGGCSANLANYRLDRWPSTYYGVDISPCLIEAMEAFVARHNIRIGGLYVADIARLPFDDNFFDIASVIGVCEYCTVDYIGNALVELHRVLKPEARMVLDIPNPKHPYFNDMMRLERYLKRPNILHSPLKFEQILTQRFSIKKVDDSQVMLKYFTRTSK